MPDQSAKTPKSIPVQIIELLAPPAAECSTAIELSQYLEVVSHVSSMLTRGLREATRGALLGGDDSGLRVNQVSDYLAKEIQRTDSDARELLILVKHVADLTASIGDAAMLASVKLDLQNDIAVRYAVSQVEKQSDD
ncbi:hypothetical protein DBP19_36505 [Streptomyces sp. CS090A]|uniref:hypothetical protein n=1 Tax=Streptomyces sp. CS090A TaxID=2162710 RepID=UPI000D512673|nr:hypothetical protein [Streptomyces sp. CS090A]PVC80642.1 hypothetical protein DBP19_36505 [Streptomyces sp. CS090A]